MKDDVISRQDAIAALDVLCQEHRYKIPGELETYSQYNEAWQDALDRAEGAIGNLPSVQPEPCEDVVSREAMLDMLHQECSSIVENFLKEKINAMPSVTPKPERKTARWIPRGCGCFECDECGERVTLNAYTAEKARDRFKFCYHCGARMEEGEQE